MASLKEVKTRINSVKSTRKITSAMKMVASAKLHKAQGAIENMLPYQKKLNKILINFLSADLPIESPYVQEREVKRVAIVVFFFKHFSLWCFQRQRHQNDDANDRRVPHPGTG